MLSFPLPGNKQTLYLEKVLAILQSAALNDTGKEMKTRGNPHADASVAKPPRCHRGNVLRRLVVALLPIYVDLQ